MTETTLLKADAVFEGGGVKGIGLVGAIAVAEERGIAWQNVAGTSAGAIVATLIAAGYNAGEMKEILTDLDYDNFKDQSIIDRIPRVGPLISIIFEKGLYEGKFFQKWMGDLLKAKNITTFGDLLIPGEKADKYRFKLRVIASDITEGNMLVLPQDIANYGVRPEDLNVAFAVRMSMSIPLFYEPVKLQNMKTGHTSYIVDGGVLSNFPVWLFDSVGSPPEWPTFGFKLVEPEEGTPRHIGGPISLLAALFSTMMEAHDARYIKDQDFVRTIAIPTLGVNTTEFDISRERSDALFQSGRQAADEFFSTWDPQQYINKYRKGEAPGERGVQLRT
ncbi:MAG: patatin-like phospholipase family protein [Dehalococcoidales bacterium]|nr:patatin-like phospholipase family protein [Dehalococcoidales bacterium]